MTDPVISPDGKWMWTGSDWIPAPPAAEPVSVSMQDSVIAGDVNITQNSAEDIANAMVSALEKIDLESNLSSKELDDTERSLSLQLIVARDDGNRKDEAFLLTEMGKVHLERNNIISLGNAEDCFYAAFPIYDEIGDIAGYLRNQLCVLECKVRYGDGWMRDSGIKDVMTKANENGIPLNLIFNESTPYHGIYR